MADRAAGKRKIAGKVTQNAPRRREISATEYPIHAERGGAFKRTAHRLGCCTYHFQVADAAALPDSTHECLHRGGGSAHILETDVRHTERACLIDQTLGILDRPVVASQHEDEIHRRSGREWPLANRDRCW